MSEIIQPTPEIEEQAKTPGRFRWQVVAAWSVVITLLALLGWALIKTNETRPEAGQPAPEFDVEFFNGYEWENKQVSDLSEMRGNVIVLNFWASWCVECLLEAELIENTWRKYEGQDVIFLGVAYSDVEPNSIAYLEEFDITYPNAPDLGTDISDTYEITGVPETFFIDKEGVIQHVQIGPLNEMTMDAVITKLLGDDG
jgi:cytochrome c biogenesis protein CcmG/thiol:disulfide interchange protein DsbE